MASLVLIQLGHAKIKERDYTNFSSNVIASVTYDPAQETFDIVKGRVDNAVAWANFTESINQTGWEENMRGLLTHFVNKDVFYKLFDKHIHSSVRSTGSFVDRVK